MDENKVFKILETCIDTFYYINIYKTKIKGGIIIYALNILQFKVTSKCNKY